MPTSEIIVIVYLTGQAFNVMTPFPYYFLKEEWEAGAFKDPRNLSKGLSTWSMCKLWLLRLGSWLTPVAVLFAEVFLLFWDNRRSRHISS